MKQWKADNAARLDELSSKARNDGVDSLTPAEMQEWANLRGAQSNFEINTLIYRAQMLGGSEETTAERTKIFGYVAIANAAGAAGGISKAGKSSAIQVPEPITDNNGLVIRWGKKVTGLMQELSLRIRLVFLSSQSQVQNNTRIKKLDLLLIAMGMFIGLKELMVSITGMVV